MPVESAGLHGVDATGRAVCEVKIAGDPEALSAWLRGLGCEKVQAGLEAGPVLQWLYGGMQPAGLLAETRHARTAFKTMPVKTARKEAAASPS